LRKDGSTFPVLLYSAAITRGDRPVGLRGIVLDITERKEVEKALQNSERNYREIFNAANEAILVHDAETGAILDVNQTMLAMFGCSYEEALTGALAGLGESEYSEAEFCARIMKAAAAGPQLFEWLSRRRDGEVFWAEVNLKSAVIGGQRRVLAVVREITDRKRAEAEAQQHQTELTRAWHASALGEMASGLAHELNQPLCAILNYSDSCLRMARRKRFSLSVMSSSIEQIAGQAERAAGIIKRIRSLVAKRDPHRTEIEINGVLNNALHMIQAEIASHNVVVVTELADDLPKFTADRVGIAQVVLNLMRNAIDAMSGPDVTDRTLTISTARSAEDRIQVTVADSGHGFSAEVAEKIFDSFFTTKDEGLGIGLSLSRRIVEAHGGRLWAQSDGSSGATFGFTLLLEGAAHG
jgi:two-component system sensor kinase FixL